MESLANNLIGRKLNGGWHVKELVARTPGQTGGNFSVGYIVEHENGNKGFLKALDYSSAFQEENRTAALKAMLDAYEFEKDVLTKCNNKRLNRVVTAFEFGSIDVDKLRIDGAVDYLIFELADSDLRKHLDTVNKLDESWRLRSLHNIAVGINQLHKIDIAHQDLKPSNVLVFKKTTSKITDLGRASEKGEAPSINDKLEVPGSRRYAPLELLYHHVEPDWNRRRFGCDVYLFGSMIVYMFSGTTMNALVLSELDERFKPGEWKGYYYDVLPYVRNAFTRAIEKFNSELMPSISQNLTLIVQELCEPDPKLRGHRKNIRTDNQYSIERYVVELDILAQKAEKELILRMMK